jgi:hypothetical protein
MISAGYDPAIPAIQRVQTFALDHTATGINSTMYHEIVNKDAEKIRRL